MDRPEELASYCPGCGRSPVSAPCQRCGTPGPDRVEQGPQDLSVYMLLGVGLFSFAVAGFLFVSLEGVPRWTGGGFLALVGAALLAVFVANRLADEREWVLVADGARATVVAGRLGVVYAAGWRMESGPLDADVSGLLSCAVGDLWAALEQRLHPTETLEMALPELMALAAAARGELTLQQVSRVSWSLENDGVVAQPAVLEGVVVQGEPSWLDTAAAVLENEAPAPTPEGTELALAWLDAHPVWLEVWQPY